MKILIVGNGGREHALAWKVAQEPARHRVYSWRRATPGTAREAKVAERRASTCSTFAALADLRAAGRTSVSRSSVPKCRWSPAFATTSTREASPCFGPSQAAAQLEGSKAVHQVVPGAPSDSHRGLSRLYGTGSGRGIHPRTRRADRRQGGWARRRQGSGRGAHRRRSVGRRARRCLPVTRSATRVARSSSKTVSIGEEASFICIADGRRAVPFASSQDHKARDDGDRGPNTGGHGRVFAGAGRHAGDSRANHGAK